MTATHWTALIPLRTQSEANRRDHWSVKAKRVKKQREAVLLVLRSKGVPKLDYYGLFSVDVTLIRFAPRQLDSDNLQGSFKAVRDGVADVFGIDDRDSRIKFSYQQEKAREYGIHIEIEITPVEFKKMPMPKCMWQFRFGKGEKGGAKTWTGLSDRYAGGKVHRGE